MPSKHIMRRPQTEIMFHGLHLGRPRCSNSKIFYSAVVANLTGCFASLLLHLRRYPRRANAVRVQRWLFLGVGVGEEGGGELEEECGMIGRKSEGVVSRESGQQTIR